MFSRRDFLATTLRSSTLLALAPTVPGFLAQTARAAKAEKDSRILVVIQLDGGNDGINTVVPFADEGYAKYRKALRLSTERLIKINDRVGLHSSLGDAAKLLESGRLAIVQGVGYPNPSRSHFQSMAIWQSARFDPEEHTSFGWLGRAFDDGAKIASGAATSLLVGSGPPPLALRGRRAVASAMERTEDFALDSRIDPRRALSSAVPSDDLAAFVQRSMLDAYSTSEHLAHLGGASAGQVNYPGNGLATRLQLISRLLKIGFGARVFYTVHGGFDTHSAQLPHHSDLLFQLSSSLRAFLDDLAAAGLAERVLVLAFSEFGRRVAENSSQGTDHGTAGPVFLAGAGLRAGLVGDTPSLLDLQDSDLKWGIDFRRIYATILEEWLGLPARTALAGTFERLPLFTG